MQKLKAWEESEEEKDIFPALSAINSPKIEVKMNEESRNKNLKVKENKNERIKVKFSILKLKPLKMNIPKRKLMFSRTGNCSMTGMSVKLKRREDLSLENLWKLLTILPTTRKTTSSTSRSTRAGSMRRSCTPTPITTTARMISTRQVQSCI